MTTSEPGRPRWRPRTWIALAALSGALLVTAPITSAADSATTIRISTRADGTPLEDAAENPFVSGNGRYVTFEVRGETDAGIFRKDRVTGALDRVTPPVSGATRFFLSSVSDDGMRVAFRSNSATLVPTDANGTLWDAFVYDFATSAYTLVSKSSTGQQPTSGAIFAPEISGDGGFVVYHATTDFIGGGGQGGMDAYLHDLATGQTVRVNVNSDEEPGAGGNASEATVSDGGRYVVFQSDQANLADPAFAPPAPEPTLLAEASEEEAGMPTQVFRRDLVGGVTELVSVGADGYWANAGLADDGTPLGASINAAVSDDGRYVAFESTATNLLPAEPVVELTAAGDGRGTGAGGGGPGGGTGEESVPEPGQVYVRDMVANETILVSRAAALPVLDGEETQPVPAQAGSGYPKISGNGAYVVYSSTADDIVTPDANDGACTVPSEEDPTVLLPVNCRDVFRFALASGLTELVSQSTAGEQADGESGNGTWALSASDSGRVVAFASRSSNLDPVSPVELLAEPLVEDGEDEGHVEPASYLRLYGDTTAPTWPSAGALTATGIGQTGLTLTWTPAGDDGGVSGYRVLRGGVVLGTTSATSYLVTGLSPSTAYLFAVVPLDASGNEGVALTGTFTTLAAGGGDTGTGGAGGGGTVPTPSPTPTPTAPPDTGGAGGIDPDGLQRVSGADRIVTASLVATLTFAPDVPYAFVATDRDYPDALTGGAAAAAHDSPVLLTDREQLSEATRAALTYLRPREIVVLGGPAAVSERVREQLRAFTQGPVSRVSGPERVATANAVSARFFQTAQVAYVATARNFPDALAAGPLAARDQAPVWIVDGDPAQETLREMERLRIHELVVIGGTSAVPEQTRDQLRTRLREHQPDGDVTRIMDRDRYRTAVRVAEHFGDAPHTVIVARGDTWPDALAGVPMAGRLGAPILLVEPDRIPAEVAEYLAAARPARIVVLGGPHAISAEVAEQLRQYLR